jgi:hypothetical protein
MEIHPVGEINYINDNIIQTYISSNYIFEQNIVNNIRECSVCLESINQINYCITKCGHMFCFPCIVQCLRKKNTCPNCREELISGIILNPKLAEISSNLENKSCIIKLDGKIFELKSFRTKIRKEIKLYLSSLPNKELKKYHNCSLKMFMKISITNSVTNRNYEYADMKTIYDIFFKYSSNVYSFARFYENNGKKKQKKVESKLIHPRFRF